MSLPPAPRRLRIERTVPATLLEVWTLWTTAEGIASWWGPEGFAVTVQELDLRPGGVLRYTMSAVAPEMRAFMQQNGMPTSTAHSLRYQEVQPYRRLSWSHDIDFVPGVVAYEVGSALELFPTAEGVRLVLQLDPMHAEEWTQRAVAGWESELGKLATILASRPAASSTEPKILPCLWFDGQAEEAVAWYLSIFGDGRVVSESRYGEAGPMPAGSLLTCTFEVAGQRLIALNGGPQFRFTEALSLMVRCADQAEVDRLWAALCEGGQESRCGWLKDRYGLSWQIVPVELFALLSDPDPGRARRATEAMLGMRRIDLAAMRAAADSGADHTVS